MPKPYDVILCSFAAGSTLVILWIYFPYPNDVLLCTYIPSPIVVILRTYAPTLRRNIVYLCPCVVILSPYASTLRRNIVHLDCCPNLVIFCTYFPSPTYVLFCTYFPSHIDAILCTYAPSLRRIIVYSWPSPAFCYCGLMPLPYDVILCLGCCSKFSNIVYLCHCTNDLILCPYDPTLPYDVILCT